MTIRHARRTGVLGLAVAGLLLSGVSPAQAVPEVALASGSIGAVDAEFEGDAVEIDPLAECDTDDDVGAANSAAYRLSGFAEFGKGQSTCKVHPKTGVASAKVTGKLFRLDALRSYGGPRIRMTDYKAQCNTTKNGSSASFNIGGISGLALPAQLPPNHVVMVPGRGPGAPPLAKVTFNESIVPDPPDGSMTVNIMRVELFPQGSTDDDAPTGELTVGTVSCSPF
jgi:hypothetical protein